MANLSVLRLLRNDPDAAAEMLVTAERGDVDAQYAMGLIYAEGRGVTQDEAGYRYALVCGPNTSYLWILARQPDLDAAVVNKLVARAASLGFDTGKLIYVSH